MVKRGGSHGDGRGDRSGVRLEMEVLPASGEGMVGNKTLHSLEEEAARRLLSDRSFISVIILADDARVAESGFG